MSRLLIFSLLTLFSYLNNNTVLGQPGHRADIHPDSISERLWIDLDKGYFEFHKRSFLMSTINEGALDDYITMATGAGIGYYSPSFHGFHLNFSGFFVFRLFEYNLHSIDDLSGRGSRYEHQLYDMNDLENTTDLDRLEEFFLTYERNHLKLELGRQKFESPFLNENDNRMRPHIFNGLSAYYHTEHLKLVSSWFISETVRGTVHWYDLDHTVGIYDVGRNPLGFDSLNYHGNISTKGVGILGAEYEKHHWKLQGWNYTADNLFNLAFGQVDYELKKKSTYHFGIQGLYQYALNHGGNKDQAKTYILEDENTFAVGARTGIERGNHLLTLNYLGISGNGRFLFPREWGREQFYASQPRERFEGTGGLNAFVTEYKYNPESKPYWLSISAGYIDRPDISNRLLNKYGIADYLHFATTFDYKFEGYLEGLDVRFIAAIKQEAVPGSMNYREKMNNVNMANLNLVIDYRF